MRNMNNKCNAHAMRGLFPYLLRGYTSTSCASIVTVPRFFILKTFLFVGTKEGIKSLKVGGINNGYKLRTGF